jgi:hypothetical protein
MREILESRLQDMLPENALAKAEQESDREAPGWKPLGSLVPSSPDTATAIVIQSRCGRLCGNVTTLCRMAHNPLSQHSILLSNFPAVLTLCSGTFGEGDDAARPRSDLSHSGPYVGGVDGCESGLPLECRSDRLPAEKDR